MHLIPHSQLAIDRLATLRCATPDCIYAARILWGDLQFEDYCCKECRWSQHERTRSHGKWCEHVVFVEPEAEQRSISERPKKKLRLSRKWEDDPDTRRTPMDHDLKSFLLHMQLLPYGIFFDRLGVKAKEHLVNVEDVDLQRMGMSTDQRRTFREGVQTLKTMPVSDDGRGAASSHASDTYESRAPCGVVPLFYHKANGSPKLWNKNGQFQYWGRKVRPHFQGSDQTPDLSRVLEFLHVRKGADGYPVAEKLGEAEPHDNGWFRLPWKAFLENNLPRESPGEFAWNGRAEWTCAWHGTKFEALYSIIYHGKIFESSSLAEGHRFLDTAPGVYVHHNWETASGSYARFVPLCNDSIFWRALWEVQVDRADRYSLGGKRRDQWCQHERSVKLAALWFQGRNTVQMTPGAELSSHWDPCLEANPRRHRTM